MGLYPNEHETIEGVGRALRAGRTSCVEVLEKCLDRIEEWEPRIKAWVRVDRDGALAQARALDEELAAGKCRGPLHGIPVGIKDIIDVKGLPSAAGFEPWREHYPDSDAPLVWRLREAGAVIMGKTVTTQFAWIDPPPTRNPWDLDRTPGGSSSGSAAAVALGMCLGAIGSQTGGSITRPASFCGVCGLKPSYKAVDDRGIFPLAWSLDHPGPIARTSRDLYLLFDAIRVRQIPGAGGDASTSSEEAEGRTGGPPSPGASPPKLTRLRGFFDRRADPVMTRAVDAAVAALERAGAEVIELPEDHFEPGGLLDFEAILRFHRTIMSVQAARFHEQGFAAARADYAPRIAALIEEGLAAPAVRYIEAEADHAFRRKYLEATYTPVVVGDALIMPATLGPAPDRTTTGDPAFNSPWSYLGWPAVSFPIGLSPDGLPLAVQLVGVGIGGDERLLKTASWCEDAIRRASGAGPRSD